MMENSENFIRVRVDLRDVGSPFVEHAWVSVDRSVQRTIRDFKLNLYPKFKLLENRNISLYLQGCFLPDEETIFLLRDNDLIRVVYENLPSLLNSQANDFLGFASSSRSIARHITDGSNDVSLPSAKKARVLPPVLITESFHDFSDMQKSITESTCLDISTEINTDVNQSEAEFVKKKHKKRKKQLKEKHESENSLHLKNVLNNNASEAQEIDVPSRSELGCLVLPKEGIQDHQGEKCTYKVINPKEHKVKAVKQPGKSASQLSKQVNGNFGSFENNTHDAAVKKSKCSNIVLSTDRIQNNDHENGNSSEKSFLEKHSISEKDIPTKFKVMTVKSLCLVSDGHENHVDTEKQQIKPDGYSNMESQSISKATDVAQDLVSPQNECASGEVKNTSLHETSDIMFSSPPHSEGSTTVVGSLYDEPLQKEGDCTQSLGNNCPKKKRRRRRKKKAQSSIADCSSNQAPSPTHSVDESITAIIQKAMKEHSDRKHIRFTLSPERSCKRAALDSDCFDNSIEKPVSPVMYASQSLQEPFKTKVSSPCEESHCDERVVSETSFYQEELMPGVIQGDSADGMKNKTNVQASDSALEEKKSKSYESFPALTRFPVVGDIIAFKMLELTDSYCPEVSNYKEGKVVKIDKSTDILEIDLVEEQVILRMGKFENVYPDEELKPQVIKKVHVQWSALIEPKLMS